MSEDRARAQVLLVEDEPEHAEVMADALRKPGHVCTIVTSVATAMDELRGGSFDVIVTDLRMPGSGGFTISATERVAVDGADAGLHVLENAKKLQPAAEVIMVTAHGDVPTARAAFKQGAYDFIQKPLDLEVFRNLVNRAAETVLLRHQNEDLRNKVETAGFEGVIAASEPMRRVLRTIRTVANSNIPVLITGESGTGKEVIALSVHRNSKRAGTTPGSPSASGMGGGVGGGGAAGGAHGGRYVAFNCAGQSESLLEDQLFGHVKGAFTGAEKDRPGVFEYADGGTLFLDEIGDMPLTMQAKVLRVLESGEVVRLGSNEPRHVDVRFVSATNRDLRDMVSKGTFREDLFFRINGSHVHLPPLRERREDIPPLVRFAVEKFMNQLAPGGQIPAVTDAAMMRLTSYHWPGNVRQLLNVVQNMVVVALGEDVPPGGVLTLDARHIPDEVRAADIAEDHAEFGAAAGAAGVSSLAGTSLEQIEKRAIRETLRLTAGNREHAAKLLGIGERTLYRKLREYGLR